MVDTRLHIKQIDNLRPGTPQEGDAIIKSGSTNIWSGNATTALRIPQGTTSDYPTGNVGNIRFDTTINDYVAWDPITGLWVSITASGGGRLQNFTVPDIPARNSIASPFVSDIVKVEDTGQGEYAYYMYNGVGWDLLATQDAGDTDAETISILYNVGDALGPNNSLPIHRISPGSKITNVTVNVITAFDDPSATITVGDELSPTMSRSRLMSFDFNDPLVECAWIHIPNHHYDSLSQEEFIYAYIDPVASSVGTVKITISYL